MLRGNCYFVKESYNKCYKRLKFILIASLEAAMVTLTTGLKIHGVASREKWVRVAVQHGHYDFSVVS